MTDLTLPLVLAAASLGAVAMTTTAALAGWRGWLAFKRQELSQGDRPDGAALGNAGTRIELADLRERIRKLEAIAAGVDL
ncbi:hypothetical protein ACBY01_11600 [Sphingomonas sp. ac-8]|uniref:hypothetical protein n=1 Tax=Sphingomonas sp. ac-8 TaxID=3242977 RepID=UPI003A7F76A3